MNKFMILKSETLNSDLHRLVMKKLLKKSRFKKSKMLMLKFEFLLKTLKKLSMNKLETLLSK